MFELTYTLADGDYYEPLERLAERGRTYRPSKVPEGWEHVEHNLWTSWHRVGRPVVDQGWKIHVSARADRLPEVLDVFAEECFARQTGFKHVTAQRLLFLLQHKHSSRTQSGKLLVAYPDDEDLARDLLTTLSARLSEEQGQYILTDRRFGDSQVVHYRYGAFTARRGTQPDGSGESFVRDGNGVYVPDLREPRFRLPAGITDPFAPAEPAPEPAADFHGITFETAIRHSNGGGAYIGRREASGHKVFIKEARAHTGLSWDGRTAPERLEREWRFLREVHAAHPGLCPAPIDRFRVWEHEFLVTEFVPGVALSSWVVSYNPFIRPHATPADFERYFADCTAIIESLERQLGELHAMGCVFGDVSPGNILIDPDGAPRLVDFEAAHRSDEPPIGVATVDYAAPAALLRDDPTVQDHYGVSAVVRLMLGPVLGVLDRYPRVLEHLYADLTHRTPIPPALWDRAARYHNTCDGPKLLPGPQEVAAEPVRHVTALHDEVARALLAMADPDRTDRVFPTVPQGFATNTLCVAYGTAGVLHALHQCGIAVDPDIVERFRRDAMGRAATLAPGLHVGQAGLAWVLAEHGFLDEARELLGAAAAHPITGSRVSFGEGAAGVAMAHLALYRHTGEQAHVETAVRLTAPALSDERLAANLPADDPTGWLHGRCGVAWALAPLGAVTGDDALLKRGVRLLHQELDRAMPTEAESPHFPVSATDRRSMPYLYCGTAGMLRAVARYNRLLPDERLHEAEPTLIPRLRTRYTVMPGLYQGLSGLGFALADYAAVTDSADHRGHALETAAALFKYAVPGEQGVRFLGDKLQRFSADLWSGGSGILLFLHEVLNPGRDRLFSLDRLCADGLAPVHSN